MSEQIISGETQEGSKESPPKLGLQATEEGSTTPTGDQSDAEQPKQKKEPAPYKHEAGKSALPFARVQKIIKADTEIPIVAKEATFLISLATEEFIKRVISAAFKVTERSGRSTIQHRDLATVVRKADEFLFLEEIIPWLAPDPPKRLKPSKKAGAPTDGPSILDHLTKQSGPGETQDPTEDSQTQIQGDGDIIMNEDGSMVSAR